MEDIFQPVRRLSLSEEARKQILERIADGRLGPGTRVSELDLSARLGVSRTPLHEAMVSLARDGLVVNLGRRGWLVAPTGDLEAREIYPIIGKLSGLALALQEASILVAIDALRGLAKRLDEPSNDGTALLALEKEFHATANLQCRNHTLTGMLTVLQLRASRLELACFKEGWTPQSETLSAVVESLKRGELLQASRLLEMHWRDRGEAILTWLGQNRSPEEPQKIA